MAIAPLNRSTGTFSPLHPVHQPDRTTYNIHHGGKIFHQIDLKFNKIDPTEYVKWCRRNLGDRHSTWDFWLAGGVLYIEVWGEKAKFTYEMWKN